MTYFDVFNGDADGILSLVQLRRAEPRKATLITGRKRDIELLSRVNVEKGDYVTVLDISMRSNMVELRRIVDVGAHVFYVDHHNAGDIPDHPNLNAVIDTSPEICTAMLIDEALDGDYRAWAVTAAFGDNFPKLAHKKAKGLNLPLPELERLGMLINYNGYGASLKDLHFDPAQLYTHLSPFDTPMEFLAENTEIYDALNAGYKSDYAQAQTAKILDSSAAGTILCLEDKAASRRISGVYGNQLAQDNPNIAHAILTQQDGGFLISIRAPLSKRLGADILALQFETGGGRSAAAGINHLPEADLPRFIEAFKVAF